LIEAGRSKDFEQILLIEAPEELQIKWLCKRAHLDPKLDRQLIDSILKSQLSPEEKRKQATDLIINDSTIETLRHKVDQFLLKLK
jgi:dephospho-CoA kinase